MWNVVVLVLLGFLALPRVTDAADCSSFPNNCNPAATVQIQSRTGRQKPDACFCPYEVPLRANIDQDESVGCFALSGLLNCGTTLVQGFTVALDNVVSTDDNWEWLIAPHAMTLRSVGCHCDANCTTTATLSFATRGGNAVGLTGGGDLACSSSTSDTVPTTFDTADADRVLVAGRGVRLSITNIPTAGQNIRLVVTYSTP